MKISIMEVRRFKGSFVVELGLDDGVGVMELFGRGFFVGIKYDIGGLVIDNVGFGVMVGVLGIGFIGNKGDRLVV